MKKILTMLLILSMTLLFAWSGTKVKALTSGMVAEHFSSVFKATNVITDELSYGVVHTKVIGTTSTNYLKEKGIGYDNPNADGYGGSDPSPIQWDRDYAQQINAIEVPSSTAVKIIPWANTDNHVWTKTTVKNFISNFEKHNPGWSVIGAVNGDFFDINGTGAFPFQTSGANISMGEYIKSGVPSGHNTVAFFNDGSTKSMIAGVPQRKSTMTLAVYNENNEVVAEFPVERLNSSPNDGQTSVFFGIYNAEHIYQPRNVTASGGDIYTIEKAELALPNSASDFYGRGVITSRAAKTLAVGEFTIETKNEALSQAIDIGVKIRVQYEYQGEFAGISGATGATGGSLLINGNIGNTDIRNRAPRTVVGRKEDGTIVFMVIDGRQASKGMYGADSTELACIMKAYGCVEAYNLDGGGSSTLVTRKGKDIIVHNSPSDGYERADSNCILVAVKEPSFGGGIVNTSIDKTQVKVSNLIANGHDIKNMFVRVNGNDFLVDSNGVATVTGLTPNTSYEVFYVYENEHGDFNVLIKVDTFRTHKRSFEYISYNITEDATYYYINLEVNDPDSCISSIEWRINWTAGSSTTIPTLRIPKSHASVQGGINSLYFKIIYNVGNGAVTYGVYPTICLSNLSDIKIDTINTIRSILK